MKMLASFLKEQKYAFSIAKLAVGVQSFLTCILSGTLLFMLFDKSFSEEFFIIPLVVDIVFVCLHLSYRGLYRGPKIILSSLEVKLLVGHIVASLIALMCSINIACSHEKVPKEFVGVTLVSWLVSLVLGGAFFLKKYRQHLC